ncbi:MAG: hypothetical protein Kow00106_06250 [Anaerolineae bacterium]
MDTFNDATLHWLSEHAPLGIFTTDTSLIVRSWNRWMERHTGKLAVDVVGQHLFDVFPDLTERQRQAFHQALEGTAQVLAHRLHRYLVPIPLADPAGNLEYMQQVAQIAPLYSLGQVAGTITVLEDVTDRVVRERQLSEQLALQKAMREIEHAIISLDLDTCLQQIATNVAVLIGAERVSVVLVQGDDLQVGARYVSPTDDSGLESVLTADDLWAVIRPRKPTLLHDRLVRFSNGSNGTPEHAGVIAAVPLLMGEDAVGVLLACVGDEKRLGAEQLTLMQDLSVLAAVAIRHAQLYRQVQEHAQELERRVAERTAELAREKLTIEATLNSASDAIALLDQQGRVQRANAAFEALFGRQVEFLPDSALLVNPADMQTLQGMLREVVVSGQPQRVELPMRQRDGRAFHADLALAPVREDDPESARVVCSLRDVSKQKELEQNLRNALEREIELGELKTRLVTTASHEFRTPLAIIRSASDLLLRYSDRMTEAHKQEELRRIQYGVGRLVEILDDLLTLSRIEGGKFVIEPVPVALAELCQNVLDEVRLATGARHQFVFDNGDACLEVNLDPRLLRYVLRNLLSNAAKYSLPGSTIELHVRCIDEEHVALSVSDQGRGIPPADLPHLFEPFQRASNVEGTQGIGLGLAIVKQSVTLLGGTIHVESVEGQGTTFTVILPTHYQVQS